MLFNRTDYEGIDGTESWEKIVLWSGENGAGCLTGFSGEARMFHRGELSDRIRVTAPAIWKLRG
jgi:hypothetical protein